MNKADKTKAIIDRKVGFVEEQHFTLIENRINHEMDKYHCMSHIMTCKWGVNRLIELAPKELQDKWADQIRKLNDAIEVRDVHAVTNLVDGCVRGYKVLEASAVKNGHVSYIAWYWSCEVEGVEYKIARTPAEASAINKRKNSTDVLALEELCRVYAVRHNKILNPVVEKENPQKMSFLGGDGDLIPF